MPVPVADKELELWKKWKDTGDDAHVEELMSSLAPLVASTTRKYQGGMPPSSIQAKGLVLARKALDTYDPSHGAKISTHVVNQVKPISRLVGKGQNFGYIPEARQRYAGQLKETIESLRDELNREPTDAEVADRMGIGIRQVGLLRREAWRDVVDAGPMASIHPYAESSSKGDTLSYVYHDLGPKEKLVFERVVGYNGRTPSSNNFEISTQTGLTVLEVERIRRDVQARVKKAGV